MFSPGYPRATGGIREATSSSSLPISCRSARFTGRGLSLPGGTYHGNTDTEVQRTEKVYSWTCHRLKVHTMAIQTQRTERVYNWTCHLKFPTKILIHFSYIAYNLKSMNSCVHKHVHRHQTTKCCAHEMTWFHNIYRLLVWYGNICTSSGAE